MSTLKEKFSNYAPQPDPKVWKSIERKVLHPYRKYYVAASAAATIAAAAVVFAVTYGDRQSDNATRLASLSTEQNVVPAITIPSTTTVSETVHTTTLSSQDATDRVAPSDRGSSSNPTESTPLIASNKSLLPSGLDRNANSSESSAVQASREEDNVVPVSPVNVQQAPVHSTTATVGAGKAIVSEANMSASSKAVQQQEPKPEQRKIAQNDTKAANDSLVVWIPNAFAPDDLDADPSVRSFKVYPNNNASIVSFEMYIYSRTGRLVFHTKDIEKAWDGTANGQAQPMGTYVYVIQLNDAVKGLQHSRGTITLIR